MFSWYKYLIVSLVFSHLGFWSGSLFLIAHFPDLCLLVLFYSCIGTIIVHMINKRHNLLVIISNSNLVHKVINYPNQANKQMSLCLCDK